MSKQAVERLAWHLRPGDRVTFGDHTGWYRVRRVTESGRPDGQIIIRFWFRKRRAVHFATEVWILEEKNDA